MSLRTDVHSAFDEIAPSTLGLSERVIQATLTEAPVRLRKERWTIRLRAPLSLVAAILLIALVAGSLIGGELWRDWRNWSTAHPPQINQRQLKTLESRPISLQLVSPGADCPVSPETDAAYAGAGEPLMYGKGPVYGPVSEFSKEVTSWGTWHRTYFRVDTKASGTLGLVLIRARDLKTGETVAFGSHTEQGLQGVATGTLIGKDTISGSEIVQRFSELVLDLSAAGPNNPWPKYLALLGYSKAATGCVGYQIDSANFTDIFVIDLTQVGALYA